MRGKLDGLKFNEWEFIYDLYFFFFGLIIYGFYLLYIFFGRGSNTLFFV